MESEYVPKDENLRVTMIDAQGDVVYDSVTDAESLDNHADRPEVQEAIENGIGQAKRHSDSINQSNYYVALKLDNGNILRVARTTNSLTNIFLQALPMVLLQKVRILSVSTVWCGILRLCLMLHILSLTCYMIKLLLRNWCFLYLSTIMSCR